MEMEIQVEEKRRVLGQLPLDLMSSDGPSNDYEEESRWKKGVEGW